MSLTGKQSPLGVNFEGAILANTGLRINKLVASLVGASKTNDDYQFGKIIQDTSLRLHTLGINDAYTRNLVTRSSISDVYDNLINVGAVSIPALGNSRPSSYQAQDPAGLWTTTASDYGAQKGIVPSLPGPATTGYALTTNTGQGQQAAWLPYTGVTATNPNSSITKWGYLRLHALQAWNEFNWNGKEINLSTPEYKEFLTSFLQAHSFITYSNSAILAMHNSKTFLEGVYSNMNDLISADIAGVSLASRVWGADLINLGNSINLSDIGTFGLPSNLLKNLARYGALTEELALALLASGFEGEEITNIVEGELIPSVAQEQQIFGSFLVISGENLLNILALMQCKTQGLTSLADLLSVRKIFPNSFQALTVPMYNIAPGPTNSKTYYLIFVNDGVNSSLSSFEVFNSYFPRSDSVDAIDDSVNFTVTENKLGSYLYGIIPKNDAIAAGAFSYTMQQIRNIKQCDFATFAEVVRASETILGLDLINGTDKPTDQAMANQGLNLCALGSGIGGSYTMSDLFGCMSGLPYSWELIYNKIKEIETTKLQNIYRENFLAITWDPATFTVTQTNNWITTQEYEPPEVVNNGPNPNYQPDPGEPNFDDRPYFNPVTDEATYSFTRYSDPGQPTISSGQYILTVTATQGGGYGRGGAPDPQVTRLLRDPSNLGQCAGGTYTPGDNTNTPLNPSDWEAGDPEQLMTFTLPALPEASVGRDDSTAGPAGQGSFGRLSWTIPVAAPQVWVTNVVQSNWVDKTGQDTLGNPPIPAPVDPPRDSDWVESHMPLITFSAEHPPIADLPVGAQLPATNGANTPGLIYSRRGICSAGVTDTPTQPAGTVGWPSPMNSVVQAYIDQANVEISSIRNSKPESSILLNSLWDLCGEQLAREQRTRYTAISPVAIVPEESSTEIRKDYFTNLFPSSQYIFVDAVPRLAEETMPGMAAPTLEAIADYDTIGGQSLVGLMREARNRIRLLELGTELDNNIPGELDDLQVKSSYGLVITDDLLVLPPPGQPGPGPEPIIISVPPDVNPPVPTQLDPRYNPDTTLPSDLSIPTAIDQVIECNCDCWID